MNEALVSTDMKTASLIFKVVIFLAFSIGAAAQLKLHVSELEQKESTLFIAIFDSQEEFLSDSIFYSKKITTTGAVAIIEINDLPFGTYAISVFQDLNGNEILDKKIFGIPIEPYGFSISGSKFTRAPTFSESAFQYAGKMELKIPLTKR